MTNRFKGSMSFTLAEMMIAMACSMLVGAAVLISLVALSKTFAATERYSRDAETQMRLLDYVSRDLSEVPSSGTTSVLVNGTGLTPGINYSGIGATSGTLTILVPGYYTSGSTNSISTNALVSVGGNVSYGVVSGSTAAVTTGTITYRKTATGLFGTGTNCCFIRQEGGVDQIVADHADGVLLEVMLSGTAPTNQYQVRVRFNPTFTTGGIPSEPVVNGTDGLSVAQKVFLRQLY